MQLLTCLAALVPLLSTTVVPRAPPDPNAFSTDVSVLPTVGHAADDGAPPDPNAFFTDVSVLPAVGYAADDGVGAGVIAGVYWREPGILPYKYGMSGLLYATNRQVYTGGLYFDWLHVANRPLRLVVGGLFWATLNDTYCGFGNSVTCSTAQAIQAADAYALTGSERGDFISTYYYRRYLNPAGEIKFLWQVTGPRPKVEVNMSWRGSGYIPGAVGNLQPYPNNYYALRFPNGERGFASVLQLGIMLDHRDFEGSPTMGYWIDASLRGAHHAWGSTWDYLGVNATARTYLSLDPGHRLVWANRCIADFLFGTPSVAEFSQIGGYSVVPGGLQGFGGAEVGRGIRQNRYLGRIRVMDQTEIRWTFAGFDLLKQHFDTTIVAFVDAAWVGVDYDDFGGNPSKIIASQGLGLRLAWDRDFIVRFDAAVSAVESYTTDFYLNINNVF